MTIIEVIETYRHPLLLYSKCAVHILNNSNRPRSVKPHKVAFKFCSIFSKFLGVYIRHGNKYLDDDVDDRIKNSLQGIVRQLEGRYELVLLF